MLIDEKGWDWFGVTESNTNQGDPELALCFARCFRGPDAERVLNYLKAMSMDQVLGPGASDAMLRHIEGQRHLVSHIHRLIERGRGTNGAS